jgi:hypothetical protein
VGRSWPGENGPGESARARPPEHRRCLLSRARSSLTLARLCTLAAEHRDVKTSYLGLAPTGKRRLVTARQLHPSSAVNRQSLAPRLSPLDLGGELKQQVLLAEATDKLYADWQARLRPGEWQADGRLAGHVLPRRERAWPRIGDPSRPFIRPSEGAPKFAPVTSFRL